MQKEPKHIKNFKNHNDFAMYFKLIFYFFMACM